MPQSFRLNSVKQFFKADSLSGIILCSSLVLSLIIANSPYGAAFTVFLNTKTGFEVSNIDLAYPIITWINDGLMAIFFLLVGLEIKAEVTGGALASPQKAILPVVCAVGGALVPAAIFALFNKGEITAAGWGIPMATDIAFALALLSTLSNRIPASLKIFLAALAVVDDLLAILIIAVYYSSTLHYLYLIYAALLLILLFVFNRIGLKHLAFYLVPAVFIWYFVHHSGIHATIAGVLVALTLPSSKLKMQSPLMKLEHLLKNPVNLFIIPVFALANTNIKFEYNMTEGLFTSLGYGIVVGLAVGKPLGIMLIAWISTRIKICKLPDGTRWIHLLGVAALAGIGFTMSIFISILSFEDPHLIQQAKFSILIASVLAGLIGYVILRQSQSVQKIPEA